MRFAGNRRTETPFLREQDGLQREKNGDTAERRGSVRCSREVTIADCTLVNQMENESKRT